MTLNLLIQYIDGVLVLRLFIDTLLLLYVRQLYCCQLYCYSKKTVFRILQYFFPILYLRDIILLFDAGLFVVHVVDLVVILGYFIWLSVKRRRRVTDIVFYMLAGITTVVILTYSVVPTFLPGIISRIPRGLLLTLTFFFSAELLRISRFNTENPHFFIAIRGELIFMLILYHGLLLIVGNSSHSVVEIIVPFSSLIHFVILNRYSCVLRYRLESTLLSVQSEKREIEREVGIAAEMQKKLLPSETPSIANGTISAYSIPAKGVNGDYYDIIPISKYRTAIVVCDVAGKGIPASLVMIMIRTIIQLIATSHKDPATLVGWINRGITGRIDIDHFATLSYLEYDGPRGDIQYCNAGHHPLLIVRTRDGTTETFDTEGLPIGIEAGSKYRAQDIHLDSGDLIVLYTDGIIEAMNPKGIQFGSDRLRQIVVENAGKTPAEITDVVRATIEKYVGSNGRHDDQTLLILKRV